MKYLRTVSFSLAGCAVAAGALVLTAPVAAQAVAAVLVRITNTAANPAITQNIGQQASQMVHLSCEAGDGLNLGLGHCYAFTAEGSRLESDSFHYTVPANQTLVITSADLFGTAANGKACPAANEVDLEGYFFSTTFIARWSLVANAGTSHFTYPAGLALGSGQTVWVNYSAGVSCSYSVDLYGYLTAN